MIWIDCSTDCRMRSVIAAGVTVSWMSPPPASLISTERWPVALSRPPSGCDSSRNLVSACWKFTPSRTRNSTVCPLMVTAAGLPKRFSRTTRRTSSRSVSTFSLRTALASTSSRMCEPPCRSRPSTSWRCAHFGQDWTNFSGRKFGTAKRHTASVVTRIANALMGEMYSMGLDGQSGSPERSGRRALLLDRLALGAHVRHHRAHLAHAHLVGKLHLDLLVVDHLGDLADQPAGGDHGIAAAHVPDQLLMLLGAFLLRPQDQEIHDDEDQDERQQRHQHVVAAQRRGSLCECGRDQHEGLGLRRLSRRRLPPGLPKCARNITVGCPIATLRPAAKRAKFLEFSH